MAPEHWTAREPGPGAKVNVSKKCVQVMCDLSTIGSEVDAFDVPSTRNGNDEGPTKERVGRPNDLLASYTAEDDERAHDASNANFGNVEHH